MERLKNPRSSSGHGYINTMESVEYQQEQFFCLIILSNELKPDNNLMDLLKFSCVQDLCCHIQYKQ